MKRIIAPQDLTAVAGVAADDEHPLTNTLGSKHSQAGMHKPQLPNKAVGPVYTGKARYLSSFAESIDQMLFNSQQILILNNSHLVAIVQSKKDISSIVRSIDISKVFPSHYIALAFLDGDSKAEKEDDGALRGEALLESLAFTCFNCGSLGLVRTSVGSSDSETTRNLCP